MTIFPSQGLEIIKYLFVRKHQEYQVNNTQDLRVPSQPTILPAKLATNSCRSPKLTNTNSKNNNSNTLRTATAGPEPPLAAPNSLCQGTSISTSRAPAKAAAMLGTPKPAPSLDALVVPKDEKQPKHSLFIWVH